MRVLITGGFGYLGGRLAQFLVSQAGDEILLGSRQQTEPPPMVATGEGGSDPMGLAGWP